MMPEMDGIEVYDRLKSGGGINSDTPVVMLTGNASEEYRELYREKGMDGYLPKPIIKEDLMNMINAIL